MKFRFLPLLFSAASISIFPCAHSFAFSRVVDTTISSSLVGDQTNNSAIVPYNGLESYLNTKYGCTLTMSSSGRLSGLPTTAYNDGYDQMSESVYVSMVNGGSEGNCGIVSMSNILAYYSRYGGKTDLPDYDATVIYQPYVSEPQYIYEAYCNQYEPKSSSVTLHTIYEKMRHYAVLEDYLTSGMDDPMTSAAFLNTCSYYGYTSSVYDPYTQVISSSQIMDEIDNGRPLQLRTQLDSVYSGHGMMVTGYSWYTGTYFYPYGMGVSVSIFCLSVLDGSGYERWYDYEQLSTYPNPSGQHRSANTTVAKTNVL